jgi:hypothetical protein
MHTDQTQVYCRQPNSEEDINIMLGSPQSQKNDPAGRRCLVVDNDTTACSRIWVCPSH